ncbi:protein FAR1-RELATED SEQUENCE 5-like isoform X2 [Magnolia sinica]|uniref:protein FAR1-RELATED SEQUENCE 5-like isoform X2 n=1 Tax=Magnolia sinica TaxID=86752 RepID=UPI0026592AAA|nr:protein FAR1-RELATED SEQUENCE 5-like isoform X2 [Magnolia sinica]
MEYGSDKGVMATELTSSSMENRTQPVQNLECTESIQSMSIEESVGPVLCVEPITSICHSKVGEPELEFIPTVPDACKPYIGREFTSEEAATEFYHAYAKISGFNVRLNQRDVSKKLKMVVFRSFCCSKEGKRQAKFLENTNRKRAPKPITRVGCPAELAVKRQGENRWVVTKFVEKHSHELMTPIKSHILPSHKTPPEEDVTFFEVLREVAGDPANTLDFMMNKSGGPSNTGSLDKDVKRTLQTKRLVTYGKDIASVYKYFKQAASDDPSFFYEMQIDDEAHVTACFWVDGGSKLDYRAFGDVICFDNTYKTDLYDVPFTPFTGVSNHKQTILFGAGLLFNETIEDFKWLFRTWLKAMGGKHPKTIITDQDSAIRTAIADVFPHTQHRFCMWHELQKVRTHLGYLYHKGSKFKGDFDRCIYQTETVHEFERLWASMMKEYKLEHVDWLHQVYDTRHMWAPAYVRNTFLAGISTTQRNESVRAMFDGYLNPYLALMGFVLGYQKALENRRHDELVANDKNSYGSPLPRTPFDIEKGLIQVYTNEVLKDVIEELFQSPLYNANLVDKDLVSTYEVTHMSKKEKVHIVTYNENENKISCSCLLFEFQGIVCRHSFAVFRILGIDKMPEHYILKRWTRHAKAGLVVDTNNSHYDHNSEIFKFSHHNEIGHNLKRLSHEALKSKQKFACANERIRKLVEELERMDEEDAISVGQNEISIEQVGTSGEHGLMCLEVGVDGGSGLALSSTDIVLWDPKVFRNKGCSTSKRFKSNNELAFNDTHMD